MWGKFSYSRAYFWRGIPPRKQQWRFVLNSPGLFLGDPRGEQSISGGLKFFWALPRSPSQFFGEVPSLFAGERFLGPFGGLPHVVRHPGHNIYLGWGVLTTFFFTQIFGGPPRRVHVFSSNWAPRGTFFSCGNIFAQSKQLLVVEPIFADNTYAKGVYYTRWKILLSASPEKIFCGSTRLVAFHII